MSAPAPAVSSPTAANALTQLPSSVAFQIALPPNYALSGVDSGYSIEVGLFDKDSYGEFDNLSHSLFGTLIDIGPSQDYLSFDLPTEAAMLRNDVYLGIILRFTPQDPKQVAELATCFEPMNSLFVTNPCFMLRKVDQSAL